MTIEARGTVQAGAVEAPGGLCRGDRVALARHTAWLLRSLGDDPATVAQRLSDAGVRGMPADARQCALAVYLRAVMEGDSRVNAVRVFHDRVVVGTPGRFRQRRVVVSLPAAVRGFVSGFDTRRYPELVRSLPRPMRADAPASSGA